MRPTSFAPLVLIVGSLAGLTASETASGSIPPESGANIFADAIPAGSPESLARLRGRMVIGQTGPTDQLVVVPAPASPVPTFPTPSTSPKVAKIEESIAAGKIGAGITALTKLSSDKDEATARAASASLGTITVWKKQIDDDLAAKQLQGDLFAVAEEAAKLALGFTGCGDAKAYQAMAATAKKDPAYAVGKEFQKLAAAGAAEPRDAKFPKLVEAFLKKHPEGFYAEQAKALVK